MNSYGTHKLHFLTHSQVCCSNESTVDDGINKNRTKISQNRDLPEPGVDCGSSGLILTDYNYTPHRTQIGDFPLYEFTFIWTLTNDLLTNDATCETK